MEIHNAPLDPDSYPGDNPKTEVEIAIRGERESFEEWGGPIRRAIQRKVDSIGERMVSQQTMSESIPTSTIASEMSSLFVGNLGSQIQEMGGPAVFVSNMDRLRGILSDSTINPENLMPGYTNLIRDMNYIYNNPQAFDRTVQAIAQAGSITYGNSLRLTMNDGAYLGSTKIEGTDPVVVRFIASNAANPYHLQPSQVLSVPNQAMAMKAQESSKPRPIYSITDYINSVKQKANEKK